MQYLLRERGERRQNGGTILDLNSPGVKKLIRAVYMHYARQPEGGCTREDILQDIALFAAEVGADPSLVYEPSDTAACISLLANFLEKIRSEEKRYPARMDIPDIREMAQRTDDERTTEQRRMADSDLREIISSTYGKQRSILDAYLTLRMNQGDGRVRYSRIAEFCRERYGFEPSRAQIATAISRTARTTSEAGSRGELVHSFVGDTYRGTKKIRRRREPVRLKIDERIREQLFTLRDEEVRELEKSILEEGIREPLTAWERDGELILIDGHHRYEIAVRHNIPFDVVTREFEDIEDVLEWIDRNQLGRRNLTDEQRAVIIGRLYERRKRKRGRRPSDGDVNGDGVHEDTVNSRVIDINSKDMVNKLKNKKEVNLTSISLPNATAREVAEEVGVGEKTVRRAAAFTEALDRVREENPRAAERILRGEVRDAITALPEVARKKPEMLSAVAEKIAGGETGRIREAVREIQEENVRSAGEDDNEERGVRALIVNMEAVEFLSHLPERCADMLLTDPPDMTEVEGEIEEFVRRWVPPALSRVRDTGRAYIMTGVHPREIRAYLEVLLSCRKFTLDGILIWTFVDRRVIRQRVMEDELMGYRQNWRAVFHLYGHRAKPLNCPLLSGQFAVHSVNLPEFTHSPIQRPNDLAERFIRHATDEGDLVIDPFAGTGTFLIAAAYLGRRNIGAEIDPEVLKIAGKRGCSLEAAPAAIKKIRNNGDV